MKHFTRFYAGTCFILAAIGLILVIRGATHQIFIAIIYGVLSYELFKDYKSTRP